MEGLKLEWNSIKPLLADKTIETLYFGGGTPYLLGAPAISEIIRFTTSCTGCQPKEITLEANPENITAESLKAFFDIGINRLSIGLQSLDDHQLVTLSRRHSSEKGIRAVELASNLGYENISIDLMYDLPGQSLESWQRTVTRATNLPITHLSLYNLTIEPHTVFFKYQDSLNKQLPDEDVSKEMYEFACCHFEMAGLSQYEISAFSKFGYISRHNTGYWTGRPFIGLGPSAFSYWEGTRYRNIANLSKYLQALQKGASPIDFSEKLDPEASKRELLAIALRLLAGVHIDSFEAQHGLLSPSCRFSLDSLVKSGYLRARDQHYALTREGILFYDTVASELV